MRSLIWVAAVLAACDGGSFRTGGGSRQSSKLALSNGHAYWFDGNLLVRAPLSQPSAVTSLAVTNGADANIHVNARYAYWREGAAIRRVPLDGLSEPVVIGATTAASPVHIALDEDNVYFPRATSVVRQSVASGAETILLDDRAAHALALDGDTLVGTSCEPGIDATWRVSIDGGAATRIAERGCGELVAVDNSFVYTFEIVSQRPSIVRVPAGGGTPVVLFETTSKVFAVADGFVYAVSLADEIVRIPASGGAPAVLAAGAALGLAIDTGVLYWTRRVDLPSAVALEAVPLPE